MADAKAPPVTDGTLPDKEAGMPASPDDKATVFEAKQATDKEHSMTLLKAIKLYPKAIGWSVLLSTTIIMEGYDLALLGNLYASPVFNRKFGEFDPESGKYVVSAAWQSGLSNGARAGEILGLILAGWASDRFGYKMTTIGSLVLMIAFIFVLFFAPNVKVLVVGEVLCGMSGAFPLPESRDTVVVPGADGSRHSLGSLPERHTGICVRSCSHGAKAVPHHVYQHVLGNWAIFRRRRQQELGGKDRRIRLQDSIRGAMGLAGSHSRRPHLRP